MNCFLEEHPPQPLVSWSDLEAWLYQGALRCTVIPAAWCLWNRHFSAAAQAHDFPNCSERFFTRVSATVISLPEYVSTDILETEKERRQAGNAKIK